MARRRRLPAPELLLAVASLVLSGLAAELYLRRFHPVHGMIYRLHPRYMHTLVPGARRLFVHHPEDGGGAVLVTVNRAGFIGPELRDKPGPRVMVYGDSFVAGEFSPPRERFTACLARRLSERAEVPVEVVNAGVVGYGPDQAALRLEDEIGALRPDLVVMVVFAGNDFGDLVRNRLFRLDPAGRLAPRSPRPSERLRAEFGRAERESRGSMLMRGLRDLVTRPSHPEEQRLLPPGGFRYLRDRRWREFALSLPAGSDEVDHLFGDPYDADLSLAPDSESARYKRSLMEEVLVRLAETGTRPGAPVVFVLVPSAFDLAPGFPHPDPAEFPAYRPSALTDALAESAARRGLVFLDLFPLFRESPRPLYFRADEHWNAEGQRLAAEQLAALIAARHLLGARADVAAPQR